MWETTLVSGPDSTLSWSLSLWASLTVDLDELSLPGNGGGAPCMIKQTLQLKLTRLDLLAWGCLVQHLLAWEKPLLCPQSSWSPHCTKAAEEPREVWGECCTQSRLLSLGLQLRHRIRGIPENGRGDLWIMIDCMKYHCSGYV